MNRLTKRWSVVCGCGASILLDAKVKHLVDARKALRLAGWTLTDAGWVCPPATHDLLYRLRDSEDTP